VVLDCSPVAFHSANGHRKDAAAVILELQDFAHTIFAQCCGEAQCKSEAAGSLGRLNRIMANVRAVGRRDSAVPTSAWLGPLISPLGVIDFQSRTQE